MARTIDLARTPEILSVLPMSDASSSSTLTDLDSDDILSPSFLPLQKGIKRKCVTEAPHGQSTSRGTAIRVRKTNIAITVATAANGVVEATQIEEVDTTTVKPRRKRQKKDKGPIMPLAPRITSLLKIGAHASAAKGVQNAIQNAVHIGYLHSP